MGRFREFLKKILPPPVNSFNREIERVLSAIDEDKQLTILAMKQMAKGNDSEMQKRAQILSSALSNKDYEMKHVLPKNKLQFEVSLTGHCNLNCKSCAHFSCLGEEEFIDLNVLFRDLDQLSSFSNKEVSYIHLLGGEPLLHPNLIEILEYTRKSFTKGRIQLVTNGLLLFSMKEDFYETCRKNAIEISVTKYPIQMDYEKVEAMVKSKGVTFEYYNSGKVMNTFNKLTLEPQGTMDPNQSFMRCYMANECIFLREGRMYPCSVAANIVYYNRHFGQEFEVSPEDSVNIYEVESLEELMDRLAYPIPFCRYCNICERKGDVKWAKTEKKKTEWLA